MQAEQPDLKLSPEQQLEIKELQIQYLQEQVSLFEFVNKSNEDVTRRKAELDRKSNAVNDKVLQIARTKFGEKAVVDFNYDNMTFHNLRS